MSITIFIETIPIGNNDFEFIQTWNDNEHNLDERLIVEKHDDRMIAAMTNLGYACKWLVDCKIERGNVCIMSDRDGQDFRYGAEHSELFTAIHSEKDYQENRLKYEIFFGRYVRFLDRIRELANIHEIAFVQSETAIRTGEKPIVTIDKNDPSLIANQNWNVNNILKIAFNKVTCLACSKTMIFSPTGTFAAQLLVNPITLQKKMIKTNKEMIAWFRDTHLVLHGKIGTKQPSKKQKRQYYGKGKYYVYE